MGPPLMPLAPLRLVSSFFLRSYAQNYSRAVLASRYSIKDAMLMLCTKSKTKSQSKSSRPQLTTPTPRHAHVTLTAKPRQRVYPSAGRSSKRLSRPRSMFDFHPSYRYPVFRPLTMSFRTAGRIWSTARSTSARLSRRAASTAPPRSTPLWRSAAYGVASGFLIASIRDSYGGELTNCLQSWN